jgi:hypothetical protein
MENSPDEMITVIKKYFLKHGYLNYDKSIGLPDIFKCDITSMNEEDISGTPCNFKYILHITHFNYKQNKKHPYKDIYFYIHENLDNVLLHLHNLIQEGGKFLYSKIMDNIYMDKNKLIRDDLYITMRTKFLKLPMRVCVKCNEICGVKTLCGHSLCRLCFESFYKTSISNKNKEIKCPQCSEIIYQR